MFRDGRGNSEENNEMDTEHESSVPKPRRNKFYKVHRILIHGLILVSLVMHLLLTFGQAIRLRVTGRFIRKNMHL